MLIRPRTDADIPACAEILVKTHAQDGYPFYAQHSTAAFVASPNELGAWIAVDDDGRVLGHVALHRAHGDPVFDLAHAETGRGAEGLAVLARLAVDPDTRGQGVGRRLVEQATAAAETDGRLAVLDVVISALPAQRLYERAGWRRIGRTVIPIPDLDSLDVFVYLAPTTP